jgi:hypothetical protein
MKKKESIRTDVHNQETGEIMKRNVASAGKLVQSNQGG